MLWLAAFAASLPASMFLLWVAYLAVMNLKRAKSAGTLSPAAKRIGGVVLALGYLLDFYVNVFALSIVLLEAPRELTVTARLQRHNQASTGWGKKVALWFEPLLDPYDPSGKHI